MAARGVGQMEGWGWGQTEAGTRWGSGVGSDRSGGQIGGRRWNQTKTKIDGWGKARWV